MEEKKPDFVFSIVFGVILIGLLVYLKYLGSTIHNEGVIMLAIPGFIVMLTSIIFLCFSMQRSIKVLKIKEKSYSNFPAILNLITTFLLLIALVVVPLYDTIYGTIKQRERNYIIQSEQEEVRKNQQEICLHPENYPRTLYLQFCTLPSKVLK